MALLEFGLLDSWSCVGFLLIYYRRRRPRFMNSGHPRGGHVGSSRTTRARCRLRWQGHPLHRPPLRRDVLLGFHPLRQLIHRDLHVLLGLNSVLLYNYTRKLSYRIIGSVNHCLHVRSVWFWDAARLQCFWILMWKHVYVSWTLHDCSCRSMVISACILIVNLESALLYVFDVKHLCMTNC